MIERIRMELAYFLEWVDDVPKRWIQIRLARWDRQRRIKKERGW